MRIRPLILAAAAAAALSATPAFAESARVEYKDLDLATDQGRATLQDRMDAAARQVCGLGEQRTGTRIASSDARKCYRTALSAMERKLAAVIEGPAKGA